MQTKMTSTSSGLPGSASTSGVADPLSLHRQKALRECQFAWSDWRRALVAFPEQFLKGASQGKPWLSRKK
jgi:hypothetical protein